jgi:hypothetical protein
LQRCQAHARVRLLADHVPDVAGVVDAARGLVRALRERELPRRRVRDVVGGVVRVPARVRHVLQVLPVRAVEREHVLVRLRARQIPCASESGAERATHLRERERGDLLLHDAVRERRVRDPDALEREVDLLRVLVDVVRDVRDVCAGISRGALRLGARQCVQ